MMARSEHEPRPGKGAPAAIDERARGDASRRGRGLTLALAGLAVLAIAGVCVWMAFGPSPQPAGPPANLRPEPASFLPGESIGSGVCAECHKEFHGKWSTSHHGLAMQPYTAELARRELTASCPPIEVAKVKYTAHVGEGEGFIQEDGPEGGKRYPIEHVMGGKDVYYFLTPWTRGRLQVLPLAYDVRAKQWFDTAASAVRHFPGAAADQALDWRDPMYTFNTSCHGCHVSQLITNYDLAGDTYRTTWSEPGINCETCHGPAGEHVRLCRRLAPGQKPADPRIISYRSLTVAQQNDACASCHAKAALITPNFPPGGRFFDHFDLTLYESLDYHVDGRDLGENYTHTSWLRSPCATSGKLACVHCHTSSGRYRFVGDKANDACLPCHAERVANAPAHTRHKAGTPGGRCVDCHMPTTEFARMRRSEHSMLPPTPAATLAHKSPNACTICHEKEGPDWADRHVRTWHKKDYQAPVLRRAALVAAARRCDWTQLGQMGEEMIGQGRDELVAASLARLMGGCPNGDKLPILLEAMKDRSPLVRASAAMGIGTPADPRAVSALAQATGDDFRLVRIRAAGGLAGLPLASLPPADRTRVSAALKDLEASLRARSDDWASQYNLGNLLGDLGRLEEAVNAYDLASRFRPDAVQPLVNGAIVQARLGRTEQAEQGLTRAVTLMPNNAAALFNLALLRAEQGKNDQAEQHLRAALKAEPTMAQAAYNLALLISKDRRAEAIEWCRKAAAARADEPRYAYTLAFLLAQAGQNVEAAERLRELLGRHPEYLDAYHLLGDLYARAGRKDDAAQVYRQALLRPSLPPQERARLQAQLRALQGE